MEASSRKELMPFMCPNWFIRAVNVPVLPLAFKDSVFQPGLSKNW